MNSRQTLAEWCQKTGILPTHPTTETGAVSFVTSKHNPHYFELWELSDFAPVGWNSSAKTTVIMWLQPRKGE
jgi:hypothetical protein